VAEPDPSFLVVSEVKMPVPNQLSFRDFQQYLRDFNTLVTAMEYRQPNLYRSSSTHEYEDEVDLELIFGDPVPEEKRAEFERLLEEQNQRRWDREHVVAPSLRQDLAYRRRVVERTMQISSFSYGSSVFMVIGSAVASTASLLLTANHVVGKLSRQRAQLANDNADYKYHRMRGAAYELIETELPYLEGEEDDPAMRQLVSIVARLESIEVTKRDPSVVPLDLPGNRPQLELPPTPPPPALPPGPS